MTQEAVIRALQNGPLTSYQLEDLTGIPRLSIAACCTKMSYKKKLTIGKIKMGRSWVSQYTLAPHMIEATKAANDEPYDKLNPFDIRNAKGIFSKAEYAVMNAQSKRLLGKSFSEDITNNQFIQYNVLKHGQVGSCYPTEKRSLPSCRSFFLGELEHETAMHYYQFNIGDYHSHTLHLSEIEDLTYRRLLDWYYLHESPIPNDLNEVARQIRMRSHSDCITTVLLEYFERTPDGWVHHRADKEIEKVGEKSTKASKSAKARWDKVKDANALPTQSERNATQDTRHITHNTKEKKMLGKRLTNDFSFPKEWEEFCQQTRPELSPVKTFDQFKDYWIAQAGQKGVKLDWFATWRNWVRSTNAPKQNPYDVVRLTVPSRNEPDPALIKIIEDAKKAAPMPESFRQFAKQVRKA